MDDMELGKIIKESYNELMREKPVKELYDNQEEVWDSAKRFLRK